MFNGETGGGSIFRAQMVRTLSEKYTVETISVATPNIDVLEGTRGPLITLSFNNIAALIKAVQQNDLIIQSGSYTPLTVLCAYVSLLSGSRCHTFITMNSVIATNTNYTGLEWMIAYLLYVSSDYLNSALSMSTWTRSSEYLSSLRQIGVPVKGIVYLDDQYDIFRCPDTEEDIAKAREFLCSGITWKPILLYVGRIVKEKRVELLIRNKPAEALLVIVGGGAHADSIAQYHCPEKGIICHLGNMLPQSEIRKYYKASDVMVSASNFETLGNTVMESLLCGTPVIVENAGGYRAQVVNGQNGYLVDWTKPAEVQKAYNAIMSQGVTDLSPIKSDQSRSVQDIVDISLRRPVGVFHVVHAILFLPLVMLYLTLVWLWFLLGNP